MSHWSHRVIKFFRNYGPPELAIHEVYYNDTGTPQYYTSGASNVSGDSLEELATTLDRMKKALTLPVLAEEDFPISHYTRLPK